MNKEELKNLKQDLLNVSGNSKGQSFTSNGIDKNIQNNQNYQARPKLSNINNSHSNNITQILGSVEYENTFANPPQEVVEKIKFIFNTMSKNNIADKSNELKLILSNESYVKWFSNFFIVNRVSAENNNHIIYNDLIAFIDSKELNYLLIKDTIIFIKKLLNSEKIAKETKEKNILKNLGNWLGILTLAKNRPILAKDLDLKELLFDAYENGRLGPIVTFVCKILEHSIKTKVFHPKNPWVQALLSVLAELYHRPNLKNTLKFEIDNIFKKFDLDLLIYPQTRILEGIIYIKDSPDFLRVFNLILFFKF
jgi:CCR4-NOT transcription complex subunit 1